MANESKFLMLNPAHWPCWPMLPVKNYKVREKNNFPKMGLMYCPTTGPVEPIIYLVNLYNIPNTKEAFLETPKETFESLDKLLEAGWEID